MLAALFALAQTITVDDDGPADFDDLPAAIAFAQPGDVIQVAPGAYSRFDLDKALRIVGAGPNEVSVGPAGSTISAIGAGSAASVAGLRFDGAPLESDDDALSISSCAGVVSLIDVFVGGDLFEHPKGAVVVRDAALVHLQSVTLTAGNQSTSPLGPRIALDVADSLVHVHATTISGGDGSSTVGGTYTDGADAVLIERSELVVSWSTIRGGDGAKQAASGDGIEAVDSEVRLLGGPLGSVRGGNIGTFGGYAPGVPGSALRLVGSSAVAQAGVPLIGGGSSKETAPAVLLELGATFGTIDATVPTMTVSPGDVAPGETIFLQAYGEPGGVAVFAWSPGLAAGPELGGLFGAPLLILGSAHPLPPAALDAGGFAFPGFTLPSLPSLSGATVAFQMVQIASALDGFSNAIVFRVL